jgi:hypothetical protein
MKKVRVTGVQILTPSMRFLNTFFNLSKLISSLKAQDCNIFFFFVYLQQKSLVFFNIFSILQYNCNILKNHIDIKKNLLNTDFENYAIHKWFLHNFDIFINKGSRTRTKVLPNVPNLPSNDEITRFDDTPHKVRILICPTGRPYCNAYPAQPKVQLQSLENPTMQYACRIQALRTWNQHKVARTRSHQVATNHKVCRPGRPPISR